MKYFITIIFLFNQLEIYSCSCGPVNYSIKTIITSNIVFKGKVVKKKLDTYAISNKPKSNTPDWHRSKMNEYTFQLYSIIKGHSNEEFIKVYSSVNSASCGVFFKEGDELYIFAGKYEGKYFTNSCAANCYANKPPKEFIETLKEFKENQGSTRIWMNPDGDTLAIGKIENNNPLEFWQIFNGQNQIIMDGEYKNGLKNGVWNYYKHSNKEEYIKECPPIYKLLEYNNGRKTNEERNWW